jgi:hypothetical protein
MQEKYLKTAGTRVQYSHDGAKAAENGYGKAKVVITLPSGER